MKSNFLAISNIIAFGTVATSVQYNSTSKHVTAAPIVIGGTHNNVQISNYEAAQCQTSYGASLAIMDPNRNSYTRIQNLTVTGMSSVGNMAVGILVDAAGLQQLTIVNSSFLYANLLFAGDNVAGVSTIEAGE